MKVCFQEDILYIYEYQDTKNYQNQENLEENLKELFLTLKETYHIKLGGFFNVSIYTDEDFGNIIKLEKEEIESYFDDIIDMQIKVKTEHEFLFEMEENIPFSQFDIYQYLGKFYGKKKKKLSFIEYGKLLEYSTLIFDEQVENIINYGKIVR